MLAPGMQLVDVAILGAAGFGGGELLRLLTAHPAVAALNASSRSHAGKPIHAVHTHLGGLAEGTFSSEPDWQKLAQSACPVLFAALPHGEFAKLLPALEQQWETLGLRERMLVIDLSGDFRLRSASVFEHAYGLAHPCPERLGSFTYGLSEWQGARLAGVKRIANPGCFATAIALALLPIAQAPWAERLAQIAISAITGSSGSGASPGIGTHHPTRAHDFRAYKVLRHQHQSEILQVLGDAGRALPFSLVPHSAPLVRGIYATSQFALPSGVSEADVHGAYQQSYQHSRFVRLTQEPPKLAATVGSNFCDLSVHVLDGQVAVLSTLDNLLKGMAGQAVQNLNLALGFPERMGLEQAALYP